MNNNYFQRYGIAISHRYGLQKERVQTLTNNSKEQNKAIQKLTYDARGRITGIQDGRGGNTYYEWDSWGRMCHIRNAEGGEESYTYDQAGNIRSTTDAKGEVIRYDYNSQGKVCAITDQAGKTETFRYDREGRLIYHLDRKGTITETKYNLYGKPVLQICTDRKGNRQIMGSWAYDDFGQLKKAVAGGFCYTYVHRPDGKLLEKYSSGRRRLSCTYYPDGTLESLTDGSGKMLSYTYDKKGRLSTLTDGEGITLTKYFYTVAGRLAEIHTANGMRSIYSYGRDGNLSRLHIAGTEEDSLLYDCRMSYDLNGNRCRRTGSYQGAEGQLQEFQVAYAYDAMNRLTTE
ncbi:MAG: RHS repeat protein, partial [Lachnospiraceae bacterium]|nr:RHS repeat protein [Lachnospiraceae bacterium]